MVPAVDSVVNDGACSPIKGIRKFLTSVFRRDLDILSYCVNKFAKENMFIAKSYCLNSD